MNRRAKGWLLTITMIAGGATLAVVLLNRRTGARLSSLTHPYVNDPVDLYVEESFPASDAPGFSPTSHIGPVR